MDEKLRKALLERFDNHRIVFWYDEKSELRETFESVELSGVTKIILGEKSFGLKYRLLRAEADKKFLLFREGPAPNKPEQNWLYDIELAHTVFHADQVSMWLSDLGLSLDFRALVMEHGEYFKSRERTEKLKELLQNGDTPEQVRDRMLWLSIGGASNFDAALERLLAELVADKFDSLRLLERTQMLPIFWAKLEKRFGYISGTPEIEDFALELFKTHIPGDNKANLSTEARLFFDRWKSNIHCVDDFRTLSGRFASVLSIDDIAARLEPSVIQSEDSFETFERAVIRKLAADVKDRLLPYLDVKKTIDQRRQSSWFRGYEHVYASIEHAARFFDLLSRTSFHIKSIDHGISQYTQTWYELDQAYRAHIYHAGQIRGLEPPVHLTHEVENQYLNDFLTRLNNEWQARINSLESWVESSHLLQRDIYKRHVKPILDRDQTVCVVISDALRFEVGEELARRIRGENKFRAELNPAISALPSYTQLGMASLLPHSALSFSENDKNPTEILADGQSTQGTDNREKILLSASGLRAKAMQAKDFLVMNTQQGKDLTRDHDLVYIYHNQIDTIGDKRDTEERTFDAAEAAIEELVEITRKLTSANMSHILLTADHGFLFQRRTLEESDFLHDKPVGAKILKTDRRFVIGNNLEESSGFKKFSETQLGLAGDRDILIPKSVNRLRVQGSGARFVHGGASLQEIVIPFIRVKKARQSDQSQVDVEVRVSSSHTITTNQFAFILYQTSPVSEKVLPRKLVIGLYAEDGTLLSNQHEMIFDEFAADNRLREKRVQLILSSEASHFNKQTIYLELKEPYTSGTMKLYARQPYRLRTSLGRDFDF